MAAIDVGDEAIDRNSAAGGGRTRVSRNNTANGTGEITSVEIWANTNLVNCEVATFDLISPDKLSTRGTHTIGGVTSGSKQTFSGLHISVQNGDYLGLYYSTGDIEWSTDLGGNSYRAEGDWIPCTNHTFMGYGPGSRLSLYGTGETWDPPTVSTVAADNIGQTTANPKGNVTATGGENPTRYIDYDIDSGAPYANSKNCGVGGVGVYNSNLIGLIPGKKYYYRARAVNSGGTGTGAEMTFTTLSALGGKTAHMAAKMVEAGLI